MLETALAIEDLFKTIYHQKVRLFCVGAALNVYKSRAAPLKMLALEVAKPNVSCHEYIFRLMRRSFWWIHEELNTFGYLREKKIEKVSRIVFVNSAKWFTFHIDFIIDFWNSPNLFLFTRINYRKTISSQKSNQLAWTFHIFHKMTKLNVSRWFECKCWDTDETIVVQWH